MVKYRIARDEDYEQINNFHNRIYQSNRTLEQFRWEFNNCPFGKSIYVIAEDNGKIVGTNCVIPLDLVTSGKKVLKSGKSEDTLVDPDYRGQNIFYNIYDFLFEKCKENGIQVIWGFTSAKKPFKKLGFSVPFDHQQSLVVNNIRRSYKYLSSLNARNKTIDIVKIYALCLLSKVKAVGRLRGKFNGYRTTIDEKIIEGVDEIINSNLETSRPSFAIVQNSEFQEWRVYQNPNYYKTHTFGFYNDNDKLKALVVLNSHPNKVAFINQSSFDSSLDNKERIKILRFVVRKIFDAGIYIVRNWHFNTNFLNSEEIEVFNISGFVILKRGIGFVWKELESIDNKPEDFYLSRIATEGVI